MARGLYALKEAIPSDLILWNKLLVMGVALGVSKEVLRQLAEAVPPEVREADGFYDKLSLLLVVLPSLWKPVPARFVR